MIELVEQALLLSGLFEVPYSTQGLDSCSNVFQPTETALVTRQHFKSANEPSLQPPSLTIGRMVCQTLLYRCGLVFRDRWVVGKSAGASDAQQGRCEGEERSHGSYAFAVGRRDADNELFWKT